MAHPSPDPAPSQLSLRRVALAAAPIALCGAGGAAIVSEAFSMELGFAAGAIAFFGGAVCAGILVGRGTAAVAPPAAPVLIDAESGLPNARQLRDVLRHEVARARRHGDRGYLGVLEVELNNFHPAEPGAPPPPFGRWVAEVLLGSLRETDTVVRLDERHFALVLTECDDDGAEVLFGRVRTNLSTTPFAHNADGTGVYLRSWGAGAPWRPEYATADDYLAAAIEELNQSRPVYQAAQNWFRGPGNMDLVKKAS